MVEAIERVEPKVVAFVHAETSTGVLQAPERIAAAAREHGALVVLDCVTSLAGIPIELDRWGIDAAYSGSQKCLSCAPGLSPLSFSDRAVEVVRTRNTSVQSWFLDNSLLAGYFGEERAYHHTAPISAIYGLAEGLELVSEEGMEKRAARHYAAATSLVSRLEPLGFEPLVAEAHRLPMLTTLRLPDTVREIGEATVRSRLLERYGIEVGGGLGALAGEVWRVGLMGENARTDCVEKLVEALEIELS